jgi:hypothetical protein
VKTWILLMIVPVSSAMAYMVHERVLNRAEGVQPRCQSKRIRRQMSQTRGHTRRPPYSRSDSATGHEGPCQRFASVLTGRGG